MSEENKVEIQMDLDSMYREAVYTDRKIGSIRVMTPVKSDGSDDSERPVLYIGQAQLMTQMGALPLVFEIEASSLSEALDKYSDNAQIALVKTMEEIKEMQRQQASSIVMPGNQGTPPGGGIQMP